MYPIIIWLSARMIEGFKIFPPKWLLLLQKWPSFIPKRHQNRRFLQHRPICLPKWPFFATKMTVFPPKWPSLLKMTVISSKMTDESDRGPKWTVQWWSWVKVDGHSSKSKRFFGWSKCQNGWSKNNSNLKCTLALSAPTLTLVHRP